MTAPLLVRLTDEELLMLSAENPVVDTPYLNTLEESERQLAARIAYRSLCSHGAVIVDDGAGIEVPESFVSMLQTRASASSTLLISKATEQVGLMRYHHFGPSVVVIEDVTDDGMHEFRLVEPGAVGAEVEEFCAARGAAAGAGEPVTVAGHSFAAGENSRELWGDPVAQLDATVWRPTAENPPILLGFLLGTNGSWSSRRILSVTEEEEAVELVPVCPTQVAAMILRELSQVEETDGPVREWHLMGG